MDVLGFFIIAVLALCCAACAVVFHITRELTAERYKLVLKEEMLWASQRMWELQHPGEELPAWREPEEKDGADEEDPNAAVGPNDDEGMLDAAQAIMQEVHDVMYEVPEVDEDGGAR